jgi:hypothetical protein
MVHVAPAPGGKGIAGWLRGPASPADGWAGRGRSLSLAYPALLAFRALDAAGYSLIGLSVGVRRAERQFGRSGGGAALLKISAAPASGP